MIATSDIASKGTCGDSPGLCPFLCVDDNEDDQILLRWAWESAGLPLAWRVAGTAHAAIAYLTELIEESKARAVVWPGLILVDCRLPGEDGFDVVRFVRGMPEIRHVPVVMWTGFLCEGAQRGSEQAGADLCVEKPRRFSEVVDMVRRLYRLALDLRGGNS